MTALMRIPKYGLAALLFSAAVCQHAAQAQYVGVLGPNHAGGVPRHQTAVQPVRQTNGNLSLPSSALPSQADVSNAPVSAPHAVPLRTPASAAQPPVQPTAASRREVMFAGGKDALVIPERAHTYATNRGPAMTMGGY